MEPEQQIKIPKGYFYSHMTGQLYRCDNLLPGEKVGNDVIDTLIYSNGIICGPAVGEARFCDTRMMHEQSGRVGARQ
jgi:hypothetical protein